MTFDCVDDLPEIESLSKQWKESIIEKPFVVDGLLRIGEKMILSGESKAGKSFALIELCCAIASGTKWLGYYPCNKSRVLYVNFEIDRASFLHRITDVAKALGLYDSSHEWTQNFATCNLRGYLTDTPKVLIPAIIRRAERHQAKCVVLDPIYKMGTGNENSAQKIGEFCNGLDKIASKTNCAVIYCHHHPKGNQSWKKPIDRAAGSGVFARDADVIIDIIELELPAEVRRSNICAWRFTPVTRGLPPQPPVDVWFNYPVHELEHFGDTKCIIAPHHELPSYQRAMNARKSKEQKLAERKHRLEAAFDILTGRGETPTIKALSEYMGVSEQTVRNSVDEHIGFSRTSGKVARV